MVRDHHDLIKMVTLSCNDDEAFALLKALRKNNIIAAGGHGLMQTKLGDHVVAYALPEGY